MSLQEKQMLKAALAYWRKKTEDMSPEDMTWLDATRERRLNLLNAIDEGMVVEELWQETSVIMIQLFHFMERHGYWSAWIPTLERVIEYCPDSVLYERARLQSQLSQLYRKEARIAEAYLLYDQVLDYALANQDNDLIIMIYRDKAESYLANNQLEEAETSALYALKVLDDGGALMNALVFETIGKIYRFKDKKVDARHYYQKAVDIWSTLGEPYMLAFVLNEASLVLVELEEYESSLATLQQALNALEGTKYRYLKQMIMMNQGFVHYRQKQFLEAENAFLKIDLFYIKQRGEILPYGQILQNIGNVQLKQGKWEDAEQYIVEAIKTFKSIHDDVRLANSLGTLAEILVNKQQVKHAKLYFDEAIQLLGKYPENAWGRRLLADFRQQREEC